MKHPENPELQALSDAYDKTRRAADRDHAGPPSKSARYLAYLDACEAERNAKKAYFEALKKAQS